MRKAIYAVLAGMALLMGALGVTQVHAYAAGRVAAAHKQIQASGTGGNYSFSPRKVTVKLGTKVTWKNTSDAPHTVTSTTHGWTLDKSLNMGSTVSFTFKKAGTYKYYCKIHPFMKGAIVVTK
jgi:plastocyanin